MRLEMVSVSSFEVKFAFIEIVTSLMTLGAGSVRTKLCSEANFSSANETYFLSLEISVS